MSGRLERALDVENILEDERFLCVWQGLIEGIEHHIWAVHIPNTQGWRLDPVLLLTNHIEQKFNRGGHKKKTVR